LATQTVTLNVPDALYTRLKQRAEQTHRSVEDELLEVVAVAVPVVDDLPADLADAISPLSVLNDDALWRAARSHLPVEAATRIEDLHLKRQREGLTDAEAQTLAALIRRYEKAMLVRAQAAMILSQRGHDVSSLLQNR